MTPIPLVPSTSRMPRTAASAVIPPPRIKYSYCGMRQAPYRELYGDVGSAASVGRKKSTSCPHTYWTRCLSGGRRIIRASDCDQVAGFAQHIDIHHSQGLATTPNVRDQSECLFPGPQVIHPEIGRRHRLAEQHSEAIIADNIDGRRNRPAVPYPRSGQSLELGPHLQPHDHFRLGGIGCDNLQGQESVEGRIEEPLLNLLPVERSIAHGVTT